MAGREWWHLDGNLIRTNRDYHYSHNSVCYFPEPLPVKKKKKVLGWLTDPYRALWENKFETRALWCVWANISELKAPWIQLISVVSKESVETGGVSKVSRLLKTECKMSPIRLFSKLNDMIRHWIQRVPCCARVQLNLKKFLLALLTYLHT